MGSKKASHGLSVIKVKGHGLVRLKINLVIASLLVSNVPISRCHESSRHSN